MLEVEAAVTPAKLVVAVQEALEVEVMAGALPQQGRTELLTQAVAVEGQLLILLDKETAVLVW
jgi:hypothetical protein